MIIKQTGLAKRVKRIVGWVEQDGGFVLACGCFVFAKAQDLRDLVSQSGPNVIIEIVEALEEDHSDC